MNKTNKSIGPSDVAYEQFRKRFQKKIIILFSVTALILGSLLLYIFKQREILAQKEIKHDKIKEDIRQLKSEHENLKFEIKQLKDDNYIKELVRKEYFFSKEGEIVFVVPSSDEDK